MRGNRLGLHEVTSRTQAVQSSVCIVLSKPQIALIGAELLDPRSGTRMLVLASCLSGFEGWVQPSSLVASLRVKKSIHYLTWNVQRGNEYCRSTRGEKRKSGHRRQCFFQRSKLSKFKHTRTPSPSPLPTIRTAPPPRFSGTSLNIF